MYRRIAPRAEVFLVHLGGPYCSKKNEGSLTIPKGEYEADEELLVAAIREFQEDTGFKTSVPFLELGPVRQKVGKPFSLGFETIVIPPSLSAIHMRSSGPRAQGRRW
jgi:predicted NUDIX family NTP pyrophosphohydrolase